MSKTIRNVKKWGRARRPIYQATKIEFDLF